MPKWTLVKENQLKELMKQKAEAYNAQCDELIGLINDATGIALSRNQAASLMDQANKLIHVLEPFKR